MYVKMLLHRGIKWGVFENIYGFRSKFMTYLFFLYSKPSSRRALTKSYYLGGKFKYLANVRKLDPSDRTDTGFRLPKGLF